MNRSVRVKLGVFASNALVERKGTGTGSTVGVKAQSSDILRAIRFYLEDRSAGGPGWDYPLVLRNKPSAEEVEFELSIDSDLWRSLKLEAKRQDVSVSQMLEHAALYYAAALDAGRITKRILEDL
ncbi:MAG TPA: hypothetical protein VJQ84_04850, partial [Solirubrobacterales bacterium]|nr:hypothetical protein [Solirubrobacterales bacterium]